MSQAKPKPAKDLSHEERKAQAMVKAQRYLAAIDEADKLGSGTWIPVKGWEDYHYIRLSRESARFEIQMAQFTEMGYMPAPDGTRCVGFPRDAVGVYLCIPTAVGKMHEDRKRREWLKQKATVQGLLERSLASSGLTDFMRGKGGIEIGDVSVEKVDIQGLNK